jgi:hypothetical protein
MKSSGVLPVVEDAGRRWPELHTLGAPIHLNVTSFSQIDHAPIDLEFAAVGPVFLGFDDVHVVPVFDDSSREFSG